tara:strand:- start:2422 stop:3573 length:1152 start_codon:yes stop_codon:yes gene_type:complete
MNDECDIFIIGGGINGAGIARDAAGRGLKVVLADMGKVGQATSSWSTKLIHGGLRYLENYQIRLVNESLSERNIILKIASSITKPLPFLIPHTKKLRPAWMISAGLFLYDHLGGKSSIPKSSKINIQNKYPNILKDNFKTGFIYYDLQVDDQKLVELNVLDSKKRGAKIIEETKVIGVMRHKNYWDIILDNHQSIKSKVIINATGPWVNEVASNIIKIETPRSIRLVKGSHIITKKLYNDNVALTLQNSDKRIIFVIPYKKDYTLIGTTEVEVKKPNNSEIDKEEINYLLNAVNLYLNKPISIKDIVKTFSGIRPLIQDKNNEISKTSRDYSLELNNENNLAPILNIYGGKITTYRKLSEKVLDNVSDLLKFQSSNWTHKEKL